MLTVIHNPQSFKLISHQGNVKPGSTLVMKNKFGALFFTQHFTFSAYQKNSFFEEEMTKGPLKKLQHRHEFEAVEGGTLVRDILTLELPFYLGGEWSLKIFIRPTLQRQFRQRQYLMMQYIENEKNANIIHHYTIPSFMFVCKICNSTSFL